jgi:hypothetical protein
MTVYSSTQPYNGHNSLCGNQEVRICVEKVTYLLQFTPSWCLFDILVTVCIFSWSTTGMDRLDYHFLRPLSLSLQRCLGWQDRRTVLVAARDVSADRKPVSTGGCQMSLLTGPPDSTGGCQRCLCWQETSQYWGLPDMSLLTGPPDSTGGCQRCLCWQDRQTVMVAATYVSADRTARQ